MARITNREIPVNVAQRKGFTANSVSAAWTDGTTGGWLPDEWRVLLARDFAAADLVYVVQSYATPIAWFTPGAGWRLPSVRYSATTSRHQRLVERGLVGEVLTDLAPEVSHV